MPTGKQVITCQLCGSHFEVWPSKIRYGGGKYCSRVCSRAARRNGTIHICEWDGKAFLATPSQRAKYCSQACADGAHVRPASQRFWEKINKNGPIHPIIGTPCWLWKGK